MVSQYISKGLDTASPAEASSLQSYEGANAITRRKAEPLYKTINDVAEELSVSDKLVRKLVQTGEIPSIKLGYRTIRIPASGLDKALKALTVGEVDE
jgi:excisionase family DNA binding protein